MNNRSEKLELLLKLSHDLAAPVSPLAILGEGNTSAKLSDDTFLVKASGSSLGTLKAQDVVECRSKGLLDLMDRRKLADAEVDGALLASRVDPAAKKPSVEALFHGWLLSLPGIEFVGHTHAPAVTAILCSPRAAEFAAKRIYPDEIVCCGEQSVLIPYTDPGLCLAQTIRDHTNKYIKKYGAPPRVILMENHGLITLGRTPQAVLSAMLMAEKVANVWRDAVSLGGPVFLTAKQVARISTRPDEEVRRKALKL